MEEGPFTVKQLAELMSCSQKTVLRKIREGKIPNAYLEGNSYRVPREAYYDYERGEATHRRFVTERKIMRGASRSISVLGIHSLGILYQNREMLIHKLREGVKVRLLSLDPSSREFEERANIEEVIYGKTSGRLRAESLASYAICKDIYNFIGLPFENNFSLQYYSSEPKMAMLISDHDRSNGYCSVNFYPYTKDRSAANLSGIENEIDIPIKNTRGVCGRYLYIPNSSRDRISFQHFLSEYNTIWNKSRSVNLSGDQ